VQKGNSSEQPIKELSRSASRCFCMDILTLTTSYPIA
jgi:hypothetical protein